MLLAVIVWWMLSWLLRQTILCVANSLGHKVMAAGLLSVPITVENRRCRSPLVVVAVAWFAVAYYCNTPAVRTPVPTPMSMATSDLSLVDNSEVVVGGGGNGACSNKSKYSC